MWKEATREDYDVFDAWFSGDRTINFVPKVRSGTVDGPTELPSHKDFDKT